MLIVASAGDLVIPTTTVARSPALLEAKAGQPLLSRKHLDAQFSAVFSRHSSLQSFHDEARKAPIVGKGLGTVMHVDVCGFTKELVMRGLVCVLKSAPAADIVDEDGPAGSVARNDILNELSQPRPTT